MNANVALIGLLTALSALGQFGSNVFLPGLPQMAGALNVTPGAAALAYSLYLGVFGVGQLVAGPMADRWGRRTTAMGAAALFVAGGVVCTVAPTLPLLLVGRVLQGLGAAGAIVSSRAVARDLFSGSELARVMASITIAFAIVPGLAPLMGGVLTQVESWRATLAATAIAGAVVLVWVARWLPVTPPPVLGGASVLDVYRSLLGDRAFMPMALVGACAIGAISAFFGASPRLFMEGLGVTPIEYGLYPPLAVSGFIVGGVVVRRFSGRWPVQRLLFAGLVLQGCGLGVMLTPPLLFSWVDAWQVSAGMVLFVSGLGVLMPISLAGALSSRGTHAGQTAAMLGFLQMSFGAAGTTLGNLALEVALNTGMQAAMALFTLGTSVAVALACGRVAPPTVDAAKVSPQR